MIAPIDKASNNVSFICKRFYATVLLQELGMLGNPSATYKTIDNCTYNDIIQTTVKDIKQKFKINVSDEMKSLPTPYWLPKMHKAPISARLIIASKKCTVKPLNRNIASAFKLVHKAIDKYHKKDKYFSGVNSFWVVQNNVPVIETLNRLNKHKRAKSVMNYDFSTLYTTLPRDKLTKTLHAVIDFAVKGRTQSKISINDYGEARWCNSSKHFSFDIKSLKLAVQYTIQNCFFAIGSYVFRQIIGIPMGSDPAPFIANLFLLYFEWQWIKKANKDNVTLARKFHNNFRYIDDLITINNDTFDRNIRDIYLAELELKRESHSNTNTHANFLDLKINIVGSQFQTSLYD